ncbi:hypothetical protein AWZ03_003987 [Drosophila navojoa]|uniref:Uncharacterized protein n=1 Tax=Drosophila navojoa TaxID=7232 RepID=A0A484BKV5_DRONA|nr:hypothetical protein AWZ03_003987 [Drosophila navojoa]
MTRATDGDDIAENAGQTADQFCSKHESKLQLLHVSSGVGGGTGADCREDCPLAGKIYPTVSQVTISTRQQQQQEQQQQQQEQQQHC